MEKIDFSQVIDDVHLDRFLPPLTYVYFLYNALTYDFTLFFKDVIRKFKIHLSSISGPNQEYFKN